MKVKNRVEKYRYKLYLAFDVHSVREGWPRMKNAEIRGSGASARFYAVGVAQNGGRKI